MVRLRTLLLCLVGAAAVHADDSSLARLLPAETPFYFESRTPTPDELSRMCLFRPLEDPQLKALLNRVMGDESSFTSTSFPLGPAILHLNQDMSHPSFAMKFTYSDDQGQRTFRVQNNFAMAWVGMADGPFPVDLVAALETDADSATVIDTLKRIGGAAKLALKGGEGGDLEAEIEELFTDVEHAGVTYAVADFGPVKIFVVPVGSLVVFATSEARARELIDRHAGNGRPSLASDARHGAMLKKARGTGTATTVMALHLDRAIARLRERFPQFVGPVQMGLQQAGLAGLTSISTVARVDGEGISATTSVLVDGPRRGMARLFGQGPAAKFGCLEFAPKECIYASCGTFELAGLYDIAAEMAGMMFLMPVSQFEDAAGFKLRDDLLAQLGPEAAFIVAPSRGLIPDIGIVFECRDTAKVEKALLSLLERAPWPAGTGVKTFRIGEARVYTVPLMHDDFGMVPLAPTFGFVDGKMLVTPFPITFQHLLRVKQGERPNLTKNRDFAKLREHVPEGAMGMSYLDLSKLFEVLYETGIPILQAMPAAFGPQTPHYELPDVSVFTKHLYGRIAWRRADDKGFYWQSHSSLDTSAFVLTLAGVAAGTAVFFTRMEAAQPMEAVPAPVRVGKGKPDPRARDARVCRSRVRLLRARLRIHQQAHGALPASIDALKAEHVLPETFITPGPELPYVYLGPEGKGGILLHGHPNGPLERVSVLTTDLQMKRITGRELERLLAR